MMLNGITPYLIRELNLPGAWRPILYTLSFARVEWADARFITFCMVEIGSISEVFSSHIGLGEAVTPLAMSVSVQQAHDVYKARIGEDNALRNALRTVQSLILKEKLWRAYRKATSKKS